MTLRIKQNHQRHVTRRRIARLGLIAVSAVLVIAAFSKFSSRVSLLVNTKGLSEKDRVVFQDNPKSCGAAALKMVFEPYGIEESLGDLEWDLQGRSGPVSMLMLKEHAEKKGLCAEGWKLSAEDLLPLRKPVILFVHKSHYIVLDSVTDSWMFFLRDPGFGRIQATKDQLNSIWSGEALVFSPQTNMTNDPRGLLNAPPDN